MSITDASTSLDTAFTEQSTITFTDGVLTTIDECIDEVEAKIHRGTLGATTTPTLTQAKNWLKRAKMEIAQAKNFSWARKYAYCSTVASQYRYALPPDYNGGFTVLRDTTNDRLVKIWDTHWFNSKYPDPSAENSVEPFLACIKNMELWLSRPSDGTYTLEIEYDRSGAETTTDDFSWIPELERYYCCDFAIAEAWEALLDFGKADRARRKFESGLGMAMRNNSKRRWKSMQYQAISVLQEYHMRSNQPKSD